jgi:catechol 2,3-dioxygenase-like lactoylglutathione lyase family enzyme
MQVTQLNHYALRVAPEELATIAAFYVDILGLTDGYRPGFPFPGRWLYCGDTAVVHLLGTGAARSGAATTGRLDHIAFTATGLAAMKARLGERHIPFTERSVPDLDLHQLFLLDPEGVQIELNFQAGESATRADVWTGRDPG